MNNSNGHLLFENVNKTVRRTGFRKHVNPMAELYVCLGGSANDNTDGVEKKVGIGDVYVLEASVDHSQTNAKKFKCCVFQFERSVFEKKADYWGITKKSGYHLLFEEGRCCFVDNKTLLTIEALADIMREEKDPDVLDALFLTVVSIVSERAILRTSWDDYAHEDIVLEMISFIEKNYAERLTLEDLAGRTNYSLRHFTRIIREKLSVSPMEYLDFLRIDKACELLSNTDLPVAEIGERCGFFDANLFSRHFRKRKKMSPSLYRQKTIEISEAKNSAVSVNIVEKIT